MLKILQRKMQFEKCFFKEKFLKLIKKFFVRKMQTTRQQFAILKFEWAAINFQLLQTGLFNQCETTVFRKIIALLSIAVDFAYNKSHQ
jgi:hypothetical protein